MKKSYSVLAGLAFLAASFGACVESGDFNTNNISLGDLKPAFLLPLVHDTLSLAENEHITEFGDSIAFFYSVEDIGLDQTWFTMPELSFTPPVIPLPLMVSPFDETVPLNFPITLGDDIRLDSARYNTFQLNIPNIGYLLQSAGDALEISCPHILVNGRQPLQHTFTKDSDLTQPFTFTNCTIKPEITEGSPNTHTLPLSLRFKATRVGNTPTDVTVSMALKDSTIFYGYFGSKTYSFENEVGFDFFKDFNMSGDITFTDLRFTMNVQNSIGIPLRLKLSAATVSYNNGDGDKSVPLDATIDIMPPHLNDPFHTIVTLDTLTTNVLAEEINLNTERIKLQFEAISNPDGYPSAVPNVFTNTADISIKTDGSGILVPLSLKSSGLTLIDTISLNLSSVSFHELKLNATFVNSMPANLGLQITLLDKNTNEALGDLFDAPIAIPSPTVTDGAVLQGVYTELRDTLTIQSTALANLKNAEKARVTITMDTQGQSVRFLKHNTLAIKLGTETQLSYDGLFE